MTTKPKKKMLTPRFDVELVETIKTAAEERGQSVNEFLKCAAILSLNAGAIELKLNGACEDYRRWYNYGIEGYDGNNMAFHLHTVQREVLAKLKGE